MLTTRRCTALLAIGAPVALACATGRCVLHPVAVVGDAAPGTAGAVFSDFSELVSIDAQGRAWFVGRLSGGDTSTSRSSGLWRADAASSQLILRAGDHAPGTAQAFAGFGPAAPGEAGACLFAQLGTSLEGSVWARVSDSPQAAALKGQIPGGVGAGIVFNAFEGLTASNDSGQTAFIGYLAGNGLTSQNNQGIWIGADGLTSRVARRGDRIPGGPTGVVYSTLAFPLLNNPGIVAFNATATGPGINSSNDEFLAMGPPGQLTILRREGSDAPDLPPGTVFSESGPLSLADSGQVAFYSVLSGPGINGTNRTSLWIGSAPGNIRLLVRAGIAAPGVNGAILASVGPSVVLSNAGRLAFPATLANGPVTSSDDSALYTLDVASGALQLIAREGGDAPGMGGRFASFSAFEINDAGQLLFRARLADGEEGLFVHDPAFGVLEVCRTGRAVQLHPGDSRLVRALGATFDAAPGDGHWGQMSPHGRIAFAAAFHDGTAAVLLAGVACAADFNMDSQSDFFDYMDFVMSFAADQPAADLTGDGSVDFFDYLDFAGAFAEGCE